MLTDFQFISLSESARNLQQNYGNISHHTLNMSLHYLVKFKCSFRLQRSQTSCIEIWTFSYLN